MLYWIWLTTRKGIGNRAIQRILSYFETPEDAFRASEAEYRLAGLSAAEIESLADKSLDGARAILRQCAQKNIHILTYQDAAYSNRLRNIPDPPAVLYYSGVLPALDDEPMVAVIGSRKSSAYVLSCAKRLGYQIASCGGLVVSGLAMGGDAMAMIGAVSAGKSVVGVLGCGVDVVYPKCNRHLYDDVLRRGCLISEYPPGTPPKPGHFPSRNRIISGLSLGVVVVEAPKKSGTLITAEFALEQGRDLFVVPGNIGLACCAGSNRLLKDGAALVENGWDVMQEYAALYPDRVVEHRYGTQLTASVSELKTYGQPQVAQETEIPKSLDKKSVDIPDSGAYIDVQAVLDGLSEDEKTILTQLDRPRHVDELAQSCGMSTGRVLASLTLLEIKRYIQRLPGNRYEPARKP